jgi:hypothetical protein
MTGAALLNHEARFEQCCALRLRAFAGPPWHASREGLAAQRAAAGRQLTTSRSTPIRQARPDSRSPTRPGAAQGSVVDRLEPFGPMGEHRRMGRLRGARESGCGRDV